MLNPYQKFGQQSEAVALAFLRKRGYQILERNYRNRYGEIDIIANEKGTIVFIEVKARQSDAFGPAKSAITHRKKATLTKAALAYLQQKNKMEVRARFDVIAIDAPPSQMNGDTGTIDIIKNAFELTFS